MENVKSTIVQNRNSGIDLLRIIAMFLIIILHILGHGKVLTTSDFLSANYLFAWLLEITAYCSVNCYCLISGYVGIFAKHKYSNLMNLYIQVVFYLWLFIGIFQITIPESVTKIDLVKALFPFGYGQYWYFTTYFGVFFSHTIYE